MTASCHGTKHAGGKKLPGTWQATPIVADGSNKDWPSPYPGYDDKAQLGYAVTNDKENLYITVETGDLATQLKILRNGLTVWIDKTGESNKQIAINFPIPQGGDEHNTAPVLAQNDDPDKQRLELEDKVRASLLTATEFSLQGFKSCNLQYPVAEKDSCGIIVHMAIDADNELVWEAVVPFKTFYFKPETDKRDKGKPLSIAIETVGLKKPAGQMGGSRVNSISNSGIRPGLSLGGMGMGMNVGGGRVSRGVPLSSMNMLEPMYKSSITWKKFGIAVQ
ncbi:MAG: hypothetical protein JWQ38_2567 [Flavipsychrobacter sp.]|nr:hypothetical protein [Flavipsychrobacter sp.]